jgi:DNA-binding MarR family transcriptional regulator
MSADVEELSAPLVMYAARLGRAVNRRRADDVPAATLRLLPQVEELGPIIIGRLAQADRCSQPTMSAAVQKLVDRGWATKQPHPADRRSWLIGLTEHGAAVLRDARSHNGAVVAERLALDPCHDVADVEAAATLLRDLLQTQTEQGTP